jgi:PAS domain S-box-containing protein
MRKKASPSKRMVRHRNSPASRRQSAAEFRDLAEAIRRRRVDAFVTEGTSGDAVMVLQEVQSGKVTSETRELAEAIRTGQVDAFIRDSDQGHEVLVLQGAEHPYRVLVENVSDGTATLDLNGTILYSNNQLAKILRSPLDKLLGTPFQDHFPGRERKNLQLLFDKGIRGSRRRSIVLQSKNGKPRTVRFSFTVIKGTEQKSICVVATELTELVNAKGALVSHEESVKDLTARLLRIQDEERRHIARDLHDTTGQKLALQSMGLSRLSAKSAGWDEDTRKVLAECAVLTGQVTEEIRTLSYLLHPPLLDELGLCSGVKWYVEGFERRTGISVKVDVSRGFGRLHPDVELTFFRIVQESLTNVHRYSGSGKAYVRISSTSSEIKVEIGDFGRGMRTGLIEKRTGRVAPVGVGIQGMMERMKQLSGKLEITSRPQKGTIVTAMVPIAKLQVVKPILAPVSVRKSEREQVRRESDSRKRILIADDHETLRRGLRTMLQGEIGWEVCGEAVDGRDALNKAIQLNPDLIILDINMPVMNGLSVVRRILSALPQTKILVFTVHDSAHIAKEIENSGAHAYLPKNRAGEELLSMVRSLLAKNNSGSFTVGARR